MGFFIREMIEAILHEEQSSCKKQGDFLFKVLEALKLFPLPVLVEST